MSRDNPIIERIRKTRRAISAETGNDLERLGAYYQELQRTTFADRKYVRTLLRKNLKQAS